MTALGKYVIPLQKDGQALAFNIQTHDTIKYTPKNISSELDRALKDATKITEEDRAGYADADFISERIFSRSIEINGYQKKEYGWFLYDYIKDTVFIGYSNPTRREYLFFAVASGKDILRACLTDMQVIAKRLEAKYKELVEDVDSQSKQITELNKENKELEKRDQSIETAPLVRVTRLTARSRFSLEHELNNAIKKREESSSKLELIQNSKFAIVLQPEVIELQEKIFEQYGSIQKEILPLPLYIGNISGIQIADQNIVFKTPDL